MRHMPFLLLLVAYPCVACTLPGADAPAEAAAQAEVAVVDPVLDPTARVVTSCRADLERQALLRAIHANEDPQYHGTVPPFTFSYVVTSGMPDGSRWAYVQWRAELKDWSRTDWAEDVTSNGSKAFDAILKHARNKPWSVVAGGITFPGPRDTFLNFKSSLPREALPKAIFTGPNLNTWDATKSPACASTK